MLAKLIKSNFRKDMSHMVTFVLIVILSSLMLQLGLCLVFGYDTHFEDLAKRINAAPITVYASTTKEDVTKEQIKPIENFLNNNAYVERYEEKLGYYIDVVLLADEDSKDSQDMLDRNEIGVTFRELTDEEFNKPILVESFDGVCDNAIYVSYSFIEQNLHGHYELGQEILMEIGGIDYSFTLAGIYESLANYDVMYVERSTLNDLKDKLSWYDYQFELKLVDGADEFETFKLLREDFDRHSISVGMGRLSESIKDGTYMIDIISAILCIFAIIVSLVVVVVIYFRITNSIEQNIVNLGALKALGATGSQIRIAHISEFGLTSIAGFLVSTAILYAILPKLEVLLRVFTYSKWNCDFDLKAFLITGGFIMCVTLFVSYFSTSSIKTIDPVQALRFGLKSHTFKKNSFPIETTSGSLVGILSLKSAFRNKRQNAIVITIMTVVGLTIAIAVFIGYNVGYKPMNLYKLLMNSPADAELYFRKEVDPKEIANFDGVDKAWAEWDLNVRYKGISVYTSITDDWSYVPGNQVIEGRVPYYVNEIAVGKVMAENNDIRIGDIIDISYYDRTQSMTVTGFVQSTANYGDAAIMTDESARALGYKRARVHIIMTIKDGDVDISRKVMNELKLTYGDDLLFYFDRVELVSTGDDEIVIMGKVICVAMVIVACVIVVLSMTLLVKTIIIKTQKELGIKKALGFTSRQLRTELSFSLVPNILIGLSIGSVIGILNANRLLTLILSQFGIARSDMDTAPWMIFLGIGVGAIVSFIIIWFLSRKIKKISAYALIKE